MNKYKIVEDFKREAKSIRGPLFVILLITIALPLWYSFAYPEEKMPIDFLILIIVCSIILFLFFLLWAHYKTYKLEVTEKYIVSKALFIKKKISISKFDSYSYKQARDKTYHFKLFEGTVDTLIIIKPEYKDEFIEILKLNRLSSKKETV